MSFDATSRADHHARIAELEAAGQPFVTATVVLRRAPVSSHMGDRAIVHADGRMEGFVGGACSREIVRRQALEALLVGQPRLVMIRPDASSEPDLGGEAVVVPMTCASEGSVNVYLEPHLPVRTLLVVGLTPVAEMVYRLAVSMGERVLRVVTGDEQRDLGPGTRSLGLDDLPGTLSAMSPGGLAQVSAVVASQGHYDELALEALLRGGVTSLALLSSRKRAVTVRELLHLQGLGSEHTDLIRAPAGLDLGARTPGEVAVSILAGLIADRQGKAVQSGTVQNSSGQDGTGERMAVQQALAPEVPASASPRPGYAVSPVDGEEVQIEGALHYADHGGTRYYFTCPNCKRRFLKSPESYLGSAVHA
jgi:xanthine dehydrogenase accessory factor